MCNIKCVDKFPKENFCWRGKIPHKCDEFGWQKASKNGESGRHLSLSLLFLFLGVRGWVLEGILSYGTVS